MADSLTTRLLSTLASTSTRAAGTPTRARRASLLPHPPQSLSDRLASSTGIGPESFAYFSSDGNYTGSVPTAEQVAFYNQHGFFITTSYYYMRPEVLESNFYAWRYTGNTTYYERAIAAYQNLRAHLKTPNIDAFASINNVNAADGGGFINDMESFWFAEVLKYLYLTFDDPSHISLDECQCLASFRFRWQHPLMHAFQMCSTRRATRTSRLPRRRPTVAVGFIRSRRSLSRRILARFRLSARSRAWCSNTSRSRIQSCSMHPRWWRRCHGYTVVLIPFSPWRHCGVEVVSLFGMPL